MIQTYCVDSEGKLAGVKLLRQGLNPGDLGLFDKLTRETQVGKSLGSHFDALDKDLTSSFFSCISVFQVYDMEKYRPPDVHWTRYELHELFDETFRGKGSMHSILQTILSLQISFFTSVRIGGLGGSYLAFKRMKKVS